MISFELCANRCAILKDRRSCHGAHGMGERKKKLMSHRFTARRTPSRTPTRYTTPTPSGESRASGRRSRRDYEESSGSQRYEPSRSERENEEDRRRAGEESEDTRGYATRSEDERSLPRFNAFKLAQEAEEVPQDDEAMEDNGTSVFYQNIKVLDVVSKTRPVDCGVVWVMWKRKNLWNIKKVKWEWILNTMIYTIQEIKKYKEI